MIRPRMSGARMGGSGNEMSSKAMVSRIPGFISVGERFGVDRVEQRVADRGRDVPDGRQRVGRVHHARPEREASGAGTPPRVDEEGRRPLVDLQHEPRSGHDGSSYRAAGRVECRP